MKIFRILVLLSNDKSFKKVPMKVAVVILNLGGPDKQESIKPFLFNFFMDKNIITAPKPIRYLLAKYISISRSKKEAGTAYAELGWKSPLLENTNKQAAALEKKLKQDKANVYKCFVSMRYWHPMADEVVAQVQKWKADKIILLPLYPQYSTTTTNSSFENWDRAAKAAGLDVAIQKICCYPREEGFIAASADLIVEKYKSFPKNLKPRLLFSAHGLPEKIIESGDPYQWQCEEGARKIAEEVSKRLKIKNLDWQSCYQSRVGPLTWIGPSTEEALRTAAKDKKAVLVYPHAFVSEHVETLVEIEMEYRHLAEKIGIPAFERVPTVSEHPKFIDALSRIVLNSLSSKKEMTSNEGKHICPKKFARCGQVACALK